MIPVSFSQVPYFTSELPLIQLLSSYVLFDCIHSENDRTKARLFLLVDLREKFSDLGSGGGGTKKNK